MLGGRTAELSIRPVRIGYISAAAIPSRTANSLQVMKMCEAMAQLGHTLTLYAPSKAERTGSASSVWYHYGVKPLFSIKWLPAPAPEPFGKYLYASLAAGHARFVERAELVYARDLNGATLATLLGLPVVFELHDTPDAFGRLGEAIFGFLGRRRQTRRIFTNSNALRRFVLAEWSDLVGTGKVFVAHNGVDFERFRDLPSPPVARAALGMMEAERFVVGYAGQLYAGRGVDVILALARQLPAIHFLVIGGNPEQVRRFRETARDAGLANLSFRGFVTNTELPLYLGACDVLLMPYQRHVEVTTGRNTAEWMNPLKMFEYMAAGRAILASDLPGIRDVLSEESAILLDPEDVEAWRRALERCVEDLGRREELAARALREVCSYTWTERARKCLDGVEREIRSG